MKALVYVSAFSSEIGESEASLSAKFPGNALPDALLSVPLAGGATDLYVRPAEFHAQFAADVPAKGAALMTATQRPVAQAALEEPTRSATWKTLPSYMIYGSADRNIPPAAMAFMAERARARETVVVQGGSHALMVSHPAKVADIIKQAAAAQ